MMIPDLLVWTYISKRLPALRASQAYQGFLLAMTAAFFGRKMFKTYNGCIGRGPPEILKGDALSLIKKCRTPMLHRETENADKWTLVGSCYLHCFMSGEAFLEERCDDARLV
jgi:hypothetical protein